MAEDMVPAHDQAQTHHYLMHYPEHPPRQDDPHYRDFESYRRRTKDTARCQFAIDTGDDSECHGGLELHHTHIEFSLQNGVDLKRLENAYPGVSDPDEVGAWVETAANLEWLCLLPDVPVRMGDGSEKAIADVRVGDQVMTHDGSVQPVLATGRKEYRGEVFRLGSTLLTPTHRVLTHRGWLMATEVASQFRMHGPHVVLVRCEEEQVLRGVVRPVSIDVMHALRWEQRAADQVLHDVAVLHDVPGFARDVHHDADVSLPRHLTPAAVGSLARPAIQGGQVACLGAVVDPLNVISPHLDFYATLTTGDDDARFQVNSSTARIGADAATCRVAPSDRLRGQEMSTADPAFALGERGSGSYGWWYALREVSSLAYAGYVHDITIANSHSFIAGGMVVHNCAWHHRGAGGVHTAASADFEASKFVKGLIDPAE